MAQTIAEDPETPFISPKSLIPLNDAEALSLNRFNPSCCLTIFLFKQELNLVFLSFHALAKVLREYFLPLKLSFQQKSAPIFVPSVGFCLWMRLRNILYFNLMKNKILQSIEKRNRKKNFTFAQMIIISKPVLCKDMVVAPRTPSLRGGVSVPRPAQSDKDVSIYSRNSFKTND